ncbi:MAG: tripartite tricarboxylate transporter substrate binding protein [Burkholderiales bacterium]|nr:tripartite tricarboxylate transporter substrate binding protein [Burkholderiales bacterium]
MHEGIHLRILRAAGIALALAFPALSAMAQADYPNKPVRVVVTFPPGGSSDAVMRLLLPRLAEKLGQQFVVDNRPGAGGNIGLTAVAKAPPDGYTLGLGAAGALSANASLYANMPFDPVKDFRPVGLIAAAPFVIVANPALAARSPRELVALARAQPGRLAMAHGGNGTAMHLTSQLLAQMAGLRFNEIAYRGSGPAALDVMGGQAMLGVVDLPASLPHIRAGKLVAIAVTGSRRLPQLPEVPTVAEGDLAGYDSTGWFGIVAPAGTPMQVVTRLNAEFNAALNDETIRTTMRNLGVEPAPSSPEAFEAFIRSETQKWSQVIKNAGIKLE